MDPNTSNETNSVGSNNNGNSSNGNVRQNEAKRQQFTNKQRMDMYAFCVLELEMHSNKVSIKKQQQAIQKVLDEQQQRQRTQQQKIQDSHQEVVQIDLGPHIQSQEQQQLHPHQPDLQPLQAVQHQILPPQTQELPSVIINSVPQQSQADLVQQNGMAGDTTQQNETCNLTGVEGKTLLQLQQEVAMTRKCYSDFQKTQVLTSSMLREVQQRFAKYYPDSAIPSRTTIKHVFEKCVAFGTVENIKTPRKVTKLPQGDEIEYLLIHEPQLSLRQLAQKLNVSTGTVSRRCKALGLVPESVTIKHQQLATARRQKQMKLSIQVKPENQNKADSAQGQTLNTDPSIAQNGTHEQSH